MIEWYIRKRYDSLFLIAEYNEMLYLAFWIPNPKQIFNP